MLRKIRRDQESRLEYVRERDVRLASHEEAKVAKVQSLFISPPRRCTCLYVNETKETRSLQWHTAYPALGNAVENRKCIHHVTSSPYLLYLVRSTHQEKASSKKSISVPWHLSLVAFLTSSARPPVPQTLTAIAPICVACSFSMSAPTSGLPGNI